MIAPLSGRFSLAELAREMEREVLLREAVYPGRVRSGKMGPQEARRRTEMAREVVRLLRAAAEAEDGQERLL
jgi:hypothetical protein